MLKHLMTIEQMPHSFELENSVIAALLIDNNLYDKCEFLRNEHFFDPLNQKIFKTIEEMIQKDCIANPITLWPMLSSNETLAQRGGERYFQNLCDSALSIHYISDYAKQVFNMYIQRETIKILGTNMKKCYEVTPSSNPIDQIENTEMQLFTLAQQSENKKDINTFGAVLGRVMSITHEAFASESKMIGVPTGFIDLDRHLGGLHKSDLLILAARPSMGKTSLGTTMGLYAAKNGIPVAIFSLEMSSEQLAMRILGQEAHIAPDRIRKGMINQDEINLLANEAKRLANIPLFIDDSPSLTIANIRTRARRLYRQEKIGMLVIDYLQLIGSNISAENRVQELSFITRSLKSIAKELNIPILALSQLSRAVEQREDKRPQLADLRESGTIEQDADVVMFIFREAYYEARKKPPDGSTKIREWQENMNKIYNISELMIAKQRHGPIKNITLHYEESLAKFGNYTAINFIEGE